MLQRAWLIPEGNWVQPCLQSNRIHRIAVPERRGMQNAVGADTVATCSGHITVFQFLFVPLLCLQRVEEGQAYFKVCGIVCGRASLSTE